MLTHLSHLFTPASLPHLVFTLPDGGSLGARDGGFLHFPLHPHPVPVYVRGDADLHHNLVGVAPLVRGDGCAVNFLYLRPLPASPL